MRVAVLMLNLGGPRNLDDVKPFLLNLFLDRDAIRFPGGRIGQQVVGGDFRFPWFPHSFNDFMNSSAY